MSRYFATTRSKFYDEWSFGISFMGKVKYLPNHLWRVELRFAKWGIILHRLEEQ